MLKKIAAILTISICLVYCKEKQDVQGAIITAIKGDAKVVKASGTQSTINSSALYTKAGVLFPGDQIQTGDDSQVDLQFSNNLKMRLGPNSDLKIESAKIMASKNFEQVQVKLGKGRLYSKVDKLGQGSRVTVTTPTALAGVRGTEFLTKEDGKKSETLVAEGAVEVGDENANKIQTVSQDQKAQVSDSGDVKITEQTAEDKKEVADSGKDLASITEQGRNDIQNLIEQFQEQKLLIQQTIKEQKKANEELMQGQKEKNQDMMREQIQKDREEMENFKNQMRSDGNKIQESGKEDKDKITQQGKQELEQMKNNSPIKSQDSTREELEKLKKVQ